MWFWFGITICAFLVKYNQGNIFQMTCDLCTMGREHSICYSIRRIQPLLIKHRLKKYTKLGWYERYVLDREIKRYLQYGGKMDYFVSGWGSESFGVPIW